MKGLRGVAVALTLASFPIGAATGAETIKLGAVVPLTGRYGGGGAQVRAGYELAVEALNAAGGVDVGGVKQPLELRILDDESDATKTVARLETLATDGVVAYAAAASVAEKNKVPYCGVAFALHRIHQQGFRYLFSPYCFGRPTDPNTGPAYACVEIIAAASARAGSLDHAKVRDAIAATDTATVIGPVRFRSDGTGIVQPMLGQWIAGTQELIWPRDVATASFVFPAPPFGKR